jgi:DNA-binding transcriptional MocR family regulator
MYGVEPSNPELLRIAALHLRADGVDADHLTVVGGALDGIERVLSAHLRPGDRVAVEDPCYAGVADLVAAQGLVSVPVAVDDRGPVAAVLANALRAGAMACLITPRAQNPFGSALDQGRAAELRSVLRRHPEVLVIEDDHAFGITEQPGMTVCDPSRSSHWAHVRSVSKSLGPDLRLAVLAGDPTTVARVEGRRLLGAGWVSHLLQQLTVALWQDNVAAKLLATAAETYTTRREALLAALAGRGIEAHGRSGLNVWIPVAHEDATVAALLERGWGVLAGERFRIATGRAIRVTTSILKPEEAPRFAADLEAGLAPAPSRLG